MKKVFNNLITVLIIVAFILNMPIFYTIVKAMPSDSAAHKAVVTNHYAIKNDNELNENHISFPMTVGGVNRINVTGITSPYQVYYQWLSTDNPLWNDYRDKDDRKQNDLSIALRLLANSEKNADKKATYEYRYRDAKELSLQMYNHYSSYNLIEVQYLRAKDAYDNATTEASKQTYKEQYERLEEELLAHAWHKAYEDSIEQYNNAKSANVNIEATLKSKVDDKWIQCTNGVIDPSTTPSYSTKKPIVCWAKVVTEDGKVYYDYRTFLTKDHTLEQFSLKETDFTVQRNGLALIPLSSEYEVEAVSDDTNIVTVSENTLGSTRYAYVQGVGYGTTKVRVRTQKDETGANGNLVQVFNVTVSGDYVPQPSVAISINSSTASVNVGGSVEISATKTGTTEAITWTSSNESVARVTPNGDKVTVTGVSKGTATITGTVNGISATCTVTVNEATIPPVVNITFNQTSLNMNVGGTQEVIATKTGTTEAIIWASSNENVAKVTANGDKVTVTAIGAGQAVITARIGTVVKSFNVTVTSGSTGEQIPTITFNKNELNLKIGETGEISATKSGTTESITWTSSNSSVARVTANGDKVTVTAVGKGTAIITAKVGEAIMSCNVTVAEQQQEEQKASLKLDSSRFSITIGATQRIIATTKNTTERVIWSSSNERVATVSQDGVVTGIGKGKAVITAKLGNLQETCEVNVEEKSGDSQKETLVLNTTDIEMTEGGSMKIEVTTNSKEEIKWSSSDEGVATVDKNGVVTAVGPGKAIITAQLGNLRQTCEINVKSKQSIDIGSDKKGTQTSGQQSSKKDGTTADGKIPQTGEIGLITIGIIAAAIVSIISYKKYRKLK